MLYKYLKYFVLIGKIVGLKYTIKEKVNKVLGVCCLNTIFKNLQYQIQCSAWSREA